MLRRLTAELGAARARATATRVLATPPLAMTEGPVRFVSLLRSRDVAPYLVAIKSVYPSVGRGSVLLVDDGTLTDADRRALGAHLPLLEIRRMAAVATEGVPAGKCWERLWCLLEQTRDAYAIQVDADVLALGDLPEVRDLVEANRPFALSNSERPGHATLAEAVAFFRNSDWLETNHVQAVAELALTEIGLDPARRYVRATAAFAGFPKGSDAFPLLKDFSARMRSALGDRWDEWGTEQVTSNFLIANLGDPVELVPPDFVNHEPGELLDRARLVHFFGTHRYEGGRYRRALGRVIAGFARPDHGFSSGS